MPSSDTFTVKPIGEFVARYLAESTTSVDPFARNFEPPTMTNDLNPNTKAKFHMPAQAFLELMLAQGHRFDLAILDMPYSPRQISECYKEAGIPCGMQETQNARLYGDTKRALNEILTRDATVLSFGWNSAGMGKNYGFEQVEILLVAHGAAHNDTICLAERKRG
jgi:hypothetical protein